MEHVSSNELSLKKVKINGNILGKFATFEIEQTFKNTKSEPVEVLYTFPISETATITSFQATINENVIKGISKEKNAAKKEYKKNIKKGNSAYLLEEINNNSFSITVGKLDKDEEVKILIKYIDKLEIVDNQINVFIPTIITPKYKSSFTDKLIYQKVDYNIDFNINISPNLNIEDIYSQTNTVIYDSYSKVVVKNYDMSKDFKLSLKLKDEKTSNALISNNSNGNKTLYLSFLPEITDTFNDEPKEYLFLVDISGSMYGDKIEQTKTSIIKSLLELDTNDKFNIIVFSDVFKAFNMNSIEASEENIKEAIKSIKTIEAEGGTEILKPIKFALYEDDTNKTILLFTDGQVGNEDEIISFVEQKIGNNKIFPFGIDENINSYFIKQLAKVGKGKAEIIEPHESIEDKINRTFARIQTPLFENIKIDYGKNKLIDEEKEDNALFNFEFYNAMCVIEDLVDDIKLIGTVNKKEYTYTIKKEEIISSDVDLEKIFATVEIERLEKNIRNTYDDKLINKYEKMIVDIAVKHNINSKYTSYLAVYERENKILGTPKFENTPLSNKWLSKISMDCLIPKSAIFDDDNLYYCEMMRDNSVLYQDVLEDCIDKIDKIEKSIYKEIKNYDNL